MRALLIIFILIFATSCSTLRGKFLMEAGLGAAVVGGTAAYFSPNDESRGMNALVFGLIGAVVGGAVALITAPDGSVPSSKTNLQLKEQENRSGVNTELYTVPVDSSLPDFIKERLQPTVIEVINEPDSVSEDGTLHAPHKVYRIQRNAELYANPKLALPQEVANDSRTLPIYQPHGIGMSIGGPRPTRD